MRFFGKGRQRNSDGKRGKGGGEDDTTSRTSISSSLFSSSKTEERDDEDKAITKLMCIMGERDIKGERGNSGFEDDDVSLSPSLFSAETVHDDDDILFMQQQQKLIRGRRNNNNEHHSTSKKPPRVRRIIAPRDTQSKSSSLDISPRRNGSINSATRQRRRRHSSNSNSSINENMDCLTITRKTTPSTNGCCSRELCPPTEQELQTPGVQIQHDGVKYKVMIDCDNGQGGDIRTENDERKQRAASSLITTKKQTYEEEDAAAGRQGAEIKKKGEERKATAKHDEIIASAYEAQQQQQEERITVPTADKSTDIITERLPLHYLECKTLVKRFFQDSYTYPNVTASSLNQPQLENLFRVDGDNNNNNNNNDALFGHNTFRFMNEVSELLLGTTISGSTDDQRSMMLPSTSHANVLLDTSYTILSECANALKRCSSVVLDDESTDDDDVQQQHDMMTKKKTLVSRTQDEITKMKQEMTRLKEENEVLKAEISKTNNINNNNNNAEEEDRKVSLQTTTTKFERSSGSLLVEI